MKKITLYSQIIILLISCNCSNKTERYYSKNKLATDSLIWLFDDVYKSYSMRRILKSKVNGKLLIEIAINDSVPNAQIGYTFDKNLKVIYGDSDQFSNNLIKDESFKKLASLFLKLDYYLIGQEDNYGSTFLAYCSPSDPRATRGILYTTRPEKYRSLGKSLGEDIFIYDSFK